MEAYLYIASILSIALGIGFVVRLFKLPVLAAFLATGVVVGPIVLNLHAPQDILALFSKLGIAALLFVVGLSLSPQVMRDVGRQALLIGVLQILVTTSIGTGLGLLVGLSLMTAIYLGLAFTLSSTVIVSKLLADRRDTEKLYGRISIGYLLVQDVASAIALVLISALRESSTLSFAFLFVIAKILLLALVIIFLASVILPWITSFVAKNQEFLLLFSVAFAFGCGALFQIVGLSIELGALAAGIALAASPYHAEMAGKVKPLRDFFLIGFFVSLGSMLALSRLVVLAPQIVSYSAFVVILNPIILTAIMLSLKYSRRTAFYAGLTVSQMSEFSFVLLQMGFEAGHIQSEPLQTATAVGIISAIISSIMMLNADRLFAVFEPLLAKFERKGVQERNQISSNYDIIMFGCHELGIECLRAASAISSKVLVVDFDPTVVSSLSRANVDAIYGDAADEELINELPLDNARLIISTIRDVNASRNLMSVLSRLKSRATVLLAAQGAEEAQELYDLGAHFVIVPQGLGGHYVAELLKDAGLKREGYSTAKRRHLKYLNLLNESELKATDKRSVWKFYRD